jgi:hypothetical protein
MSPFRLPAVLVFFFVSSLALAQQTPRKPTTTGRSTPAAPVSKASFGSVPIHFEENVGQTDPAVRFIARGAGYTIFLTPQETVFLLSTVEKVPRNPHDRHKQRPFRPSKQALAIRMKLLGASALPEIAGTSKLPGTSNYFFGKNKTRWRTQIANYASATYSGVYPGIDMVYYGNQRQLEYDFVVQPGADPSAIKFTFSGISETSLSAAGDLQMKSGLRTLVLHSPSIYQLENGVRKPINGRYSINPDCSVGVTVANFDRSKQLVIDPILQYSTYVGGSGDDLLFGLKLDAQGNSYIVGATASPDFPVNRIVGDPVVSSATVPFISKLDPTGTTLLYSDYFGGSGQDYANGLAVDANGSAYVVGSTSSSDFPLTASALQSNLASGATNAFLAKFSPDGSALAYSTYLGGAADDEATTVAVDSAQNAYLTGFATSSGSTPFPVTSATAFQITLNSPSGNAFLTRIDTTQSGASSLIYSTLLGGSSSQPFGDIANDIALDSASRAYLSGESTSPDFPVTTTLPNSSINLNGSAFASIIDTTQTGAASLVYSTYLAGTGAMGEGAYALALDPNQKLYITGFTSSSDFPTTSSIAPCPTDPNSLGTVFVAKLDPVQSGQSTLVYSTCAGGSGTPNQGDLPQNIAVDPNGVAYYVGITDSADFPLTPDALQSTYNAASGSGFLSILNAAGTGLIYSSYLGGSNTSIATNVALDSSFNIYVGGSTASTDLPGTSGEFQPALSGGYDAFLSKFSGLGLPFVSSLSNNAASPGAQININGGNFGSSQGSGTVAFGGTSATIVSWSNSTILVTVPSLSAGSAPIVVTTPSGATTPAAFSISALTLSSLTLSSAPVGAIVGLIGSGFGTNQPIVTFNGVLAIPNGFGDTFISVAVPAGATTGNVVVIASGAVSNPLPFTVVASQFPPSISASISPSPNANNWNNTNVSISYTCGAGGNVNNGGVPLTHSSCPPAQLVTTEGANQQLAATVTDAGANTTSITTTVNIDKTPPVVTVNSPADGTGFNTSAVTISGSASDTLSGLASVTCNGTSVTVTSGTFSCNISLNPGVNLVMVQATDNAGNVGASLLHLTFVTTLPAPSSLQITPANANVLVGATQQFTAVDQLGRPRPDATWTVDNTSIATISTDTSPILTGVAAGTATLTATIGSVSAQVQVNVLAGTSLPVGTVVWSAPQAPGFTALQIVQAVPTANGTPDLYSIEQDQNLDILVLALTSGGQQLWQSLIPASQGQFINQFTPMMGDSSGGLLIVTNQGILDLDGQSGGIAWQNSTLTAGIARVGQDGSVLSVDSNGDFARVNPQSGQPIPAYTPPVQFATSETGTCINNVPVVTGLNSGTNPGIIVGPSVVDAQGNAFFTMSVFTSTGGGLGCVEGDPTGLPGTSSTTFYVVQLTPTGSTTITTLPIALPLPQFDQLTPPSVLAPDGNGGAFVQWATTNSGAVIMDTSTGATYSSPLPNGLATQLVIGQNNNPLFTDGSTIGTVVSGQAQLSYQSTGGNLTITAATGDGGLAINDSQQGAIQLDSSGTPGSPVPALQGAVPLDLFHWQVILNGVVSILWSPNGSNGVLNTLADTDAPVPSGDPQHQGEPPRCHVVHCALAPVSDVVVGTASPFQRNLTYGVYEQQNGQLVPLYEVPKRPYLITLFEESISGPALKCINGCVNEKDDPQLFREGLFKDDLSALLGPTSVAKQIYFVQRGQVPVFWPDQTGTSWFGAFSQTATVSANDPRGATFQQATPLTPAFGCLPGPIGERGCDTMAP